MSDEAKLLAAEVGGELSEGLLNLPPDRLVWLAEAVRETKAVNADSIESSVTESVNNLPIMLRGPARAILGGK